MKRMRNKEVSSHQRVAQCNGARAPVKMDNARMPLMFPRTLKLKVRPESYGWLNAAAVDGSGDRPLRGTMSER